MHFLHRSPSLSAFVSVGTNFLVGRRCIIEPVLFVSVQGA